MILFRKYQAKLYYQSTNLIPVQKGEGLDFILLMDKIGTLASDIHILY